MSDNWNQLISPYPALDVRVDIKFADGRVEQGYYRWKNDRKTWFKADGVNTFSAADSPIVAWRYRVEPKTSKDLLNPDKIETVHEMVRHLWDSQCSSCSKIADHLRYREKQLDYAISHLQAMKVQLFSPED